MNSKCKYCANKEQCAECDKEWKDKFVPSKEVEKYFRKGYCGVRGINGFVWSFDTTNEALKPTHSIQICGDYHCPYCGEKMYVIQEKKSLGVIGHCCICEGARNEVAYEKRKRELKEKYEKELRLLREEYSDRLTFCSDRLFEIRQKKEKDSFSFFHHEYNHFSMLNGAGIDSMEQMLP